MLAALGIVALLAAQPSVAVRSPYLEAVRRYGPGTEAEAIAALRAIRLRDADQVFEELDGRICAAVGNGGEPSATRANHESVSCMLNHRPERPNRYPCSA